MGSNWTQSFILIYGLAQAIATDLRRLSLDLSMGREVGDAALGRSESMQIEADTDTPVPSPGPSRSQSPSHARHHFIHSPAAQGRRQLVRELRRCSLAGELILLMALSDICLCMLGAP